MEMPLAAPRAGRISKLLIQEGAQLNAGQVVIEVGEDINEPTDVAGEGAAK